MVKTRVKKNLYFEIKERVVEESFDGYRVNKNKRMVKVYGLDSTQAVRARLIEILYDRVDQHKDKFVAPILHDEMEAMEVKKSGKVEHSDQSHDDQVFSYLMAMYVWYDGKNLMENFGLRKNTIKTDENEDIEDFAGGIEESEKTQEIDLTVATEDENSELAAQMAYIAEASKAKLALAHSVDTYKEEQSELEYTLATDRVFREAYNKKYNIPNDDDIRTLVTLPNSVFLDDDELEAREASKNGNLYNIFNML